MPSLRTLAALLRGPRLCLLPRSTDGPESRRAPDPRGPALIGLLVTVLLVLGGVLLIHVLGRASRLQDCVMSGRTNCAPIDPASTDGR
ncbi:MAG: hypothetical protein WAU49_21320 [Steroidobacteraceae bacterium]